MFFSSNGSTECASLELPYPPHSLHPIQAAQRPADSAAKRSAEEIIGTAGDSLVTAMSPELSDLRRGNLREADLEKANLQKARLVVADLRRANLSEANLQRASLYKANLQRANLNGANLREANLEGANLEGAYIQLADFSGAKILAEQVDRVACGDRYTVLPVKSHRFVFCSGSE